MKKIKIMFEYLHDAVWYCNEKGLELWDTSDFSDFINDKELTETSEKLGYLYSSFFYFDYKDLPCYFNEEEEKQNKEVMLKMLNKINERLNALNNGRFEIIDEETERVKNL